jgi:hypothetical protein
MKTRRWLITILILAILAAYVFLGMSYVGQHRQNTDLTTGLSGLKVLLAAMPNVTTDLDQRLAAVQGKLAAAEGAFIGETNDILIVNAILRLAEEVGVKALPLSTQPWTAEQISSRNFSVFHLSIQITGDFPHLQDFLSRLETGDLNTLAFTYLQVVRAPLNLNANTAPADSSTNTTTVNSSINTATANSVVNTITVDSSANMTVNLNIAVYTLTPGG